MDSLIRLVDVFFRYRKGTREIEILRNHQSEIRKNEFVSLVGLSGCGKSTVLKMIAGLYEPTVGRIEFSQDPHSNRLGKIGLMPQQDLLMPWRTVADNAGMALEIQGMPNKEIRQRVLELLPAFGLEGTDHLHPHELSGGMRQRVSFLRAVLGGHSLQLLDEPFSALDAFTRREMQIWLSKAWQQWDQSILLITHDMEEALWLSDRIYIMSKPQVGPFLEVQVPFPRPRNKALLATKEFVELREKVTSLLYEKVEQ